MARKRAADGRTYALPKRKALTSDEEAALMGWRFDLSSIYSLLLIPIRLLSTEELFAAGLLAQDYGHRIKESNYSRKLGVSIGESIPDLPAETPIPEKK